jgi:hypothetical protein
MCGARRINHSQFVDDTLLIGGASITIAKRFKTLWTNSLMPQGDSSTVPNPKSTLGTPLQEHP